MKITWGEFKKRVEEQGMKDSDPIWFIDIDGYEDVTVLRDEDLGVRVTD